MKSKYLIAVGASLAVVLYLGSKNDTLPLTNTGQQTVVKSKLLTPDELWEQEHQQDDEPLPSAVNALKPEKELTAPKGEQIKLNESAEKATLIPNYESSSVSDTFEDIIVTPEMVEQEAESKARQIAKASVNIASRDYELTDELDISAMEQEAESRARQVAKANGNIISRDYELTDELDISAMEQEAESRARQTAIANGDSVLRDYEMIDELDTSSLEQEAESKARQTSKANGNGGIEGEMYDELDISIPEQ